MKQNHETSIQLAKRFQDAAKNLRTLRPLTEEIESFSLADGYAVQKAGFEMAIADGARLAGYKMGLTSRAKQNDVKVFETIRGYLLSTGEILKGETVDSRRWIHPRVEPEIAVVLKNRLAGPDVTLRDVVQSIALVLPALEIIDSRFEKFAFKLSDVVADNCSGAGFMVGRNDYSRRLPDLNLLGVVVKKNGEILETGAPAAVLGDPLLSVVGLALSLAREGKAIEPGQVILTGGITAAVPFAMGDSIEILWPGEQLNFRVS